MSNDSARTHDVAIVGFGPVGQTLALLLGRAGHDVIALERWPDPYPLPRAAHFDHEIGRIFQSAGVGDAVRAVTDPVPDHYEWRNAAGQPLVRIDWAGLGPSGWPIANFFSQPEVEDVLIAAVGRQPGVTVRRGREVTDLRVEADRVRLTTVGTDGERPTGETDEVTARYVVGADGANSFVRSRMDTPVTDLGFFYDWLIVDTRPHERTEWSPMNWQLCDPKRPTTLVSGGPGRRRWEFMRLPHEDVEELATPEAAWRLLEPWGRTPENTTIERHAVYTFQARWVERWREGRLLLAGDAAHLMPPFAGQGMCSGLRDAANLAWKLDLVLEGRADDALLDTYTSERRDHVQHAIGMSMALGQVICVLDEEEAAARDARMIAAGADPRHALPPTPPPVLGDGVLQRAPDGGRAPEVGHLTPQFEVTHRGRTALLDDLTGGGFTLLTDGAAPLDALDAADRAFLAAIGATVVPLYAGEAPPDGYLDAPDGYLSHLRAHGHVAAVVRPDFYLFGAAADAAELRTLVGQLRASLRPPADDPAPAAEPAATAAP
ncbi:bifunctional 3-(3-hydroxy-phenyl)propionate/3-hydroxycinnamic acid hydroxylase [Streptomyces sp. 3MP-14]|uniref:Bifunctional 3-(3-hydroxy-phenyl)propionate/3-hydroxycinnamic acid hydroxylase n=1 Tax=Streptomyces mimosae TaxID=2586635 RepID=A0A5N5ZSH6_9ACTN|nr:MULTISPECIES: bifunctional 3-(3-hydroxy-phenyl)propionate/3-hydroxycinnamic acid hydroxylase [Streptomyces]KAB8159457.1 bifunctional 3-(3-hydroxy-phenyl)propionate/3-hydroxycinnamic acid hydroxylase [Streptomyces mimosae]KAB8172655.1 bifunctional 3-(3-hydroxy-phenyl)propionate/3-hydroxycinnamic acid hydroxylase [Streptomyces sp. 3MP-14]